MPKLKLPRLTKWCPIIILALPLTLSYLYFSINIIVFYQKIPSFIQQQLKYISTTCQTAMTTSGKISKNNQF